MEYEQNIRVNSRNFSLLEAQRGGCAIYAGDDCFLRMGLPQKLLKDLKLHKQMEGLGFPVARLLEEGKFKDFSYFIEESLGQEHFGRIFKNDTQKLGHVSDEFFAKFLDVCLKFAKAQLKSVVTGKDWPGFEYGIHLDILVQELPKEKKAILIKYEACREKLKVFPFGILHGDFTPFNICPKGVMDLEDSFLGPVAFDISSLMRLQDWFPDTSNDEYHKVYRLTLEQKNNFISAVDDLYAINNLPKPSLFEEEFNFLKGVWFCVRMQHMPELQSFRYKKLLSLLYAQS